MTGRALRRGGLYSRVCDPSWTDPLDTAYALHRGGRWNAPDAFGALYLDATVTVAAANARRNFDGEIATLYDLQPDQQPDLAIVEVREASFLDVVTPECLRSLRLPSAYPVGVTHVRCQRIALRVFADREIHGVACRSAVEATATSFLGEEVAIFDRSLDLVSLRKRLPFSKWYPTEVS